MGGMLGISVAAVILHAEIGALVGEIVAA